MVSLINKQLLLTAYAYLFIMEQQKAQQGGEALQLQVESTQQGAFLKFIHNKNLLADLIKFLGKEKIPVSGKSDESGLTDWYDKGATNDDKTKIHKFIETKRLAKEQRLAEAEKKEEDRLATLAQEKNKANAEKETQADVFDGLKKKVTEFKTKDWKGGKDNVHLLTRKQGIFVKQTLSANKVWDHGKVFNKLKKPFRGEPSRVSVYLAIMSRSGDFIKDNYMHSEIWFCDSQGEHPDKSPTNCSTFFFGSARYELTDGHVVDGHVCSNSMANADTGGFSLKNLSLIQLTGSIEEADAKKALFAPPVVYSFEGWYTGDELTFHPLLTLDTTLNSNGYAFLVVYQFFRLLLASVPEKQNADCLVSEVHGLFEALGVTNFQNVKTMKKLVERMNREQPRTAVKKCFSGAKAKQEEALRQEFEGAWPHKEKLDKLKKNNKDNADLIATWEEVNAYLGDLGNAVSESPTFEKKDSGKFVFASQEKGGFGVADLKAARFSEIYLGTWDRKTQLDKVLGSMGVDWFPRDNWTPNNRTGDEKVEIIWHLRKGTVVDHSEIVLREKQPGLSSTVLSFATPNWVAGTIGAAGTLCETFFSEEKDVSVRSILVKIPGTFALKKVLGVIEGNHYLARGAPATVDSQKYQWFSRNGNHNCHGFVRYFLHRLAGVELDTSRQLLQKLGVTDLAIGLFPEEKTKTSTMTKIQSYFK